MLILPHRSWFSKHMRWKSADINSDEEVLDEDEDDAGLCLDVSAHLPRSTEQDYSPFTGPHHTRSVTLPNGFFETPLVEHLPLCNANSYKCQRSMSIGTSSGLRFDLPLLFFKLFFTDLVFSTLAENTNLYASEKHAGNQGRPWWPCSAAELKVWIGLLIYLSVFGTARPEELWKHASEYPEHCISRSRFYEKLEPIASMLQQSFQKYVVPATNVAIDECMVRFTGRSAHTIMIRGKPVPVGYYLLALCEAGYMYAFTFSSAVSEFSGVDLPAMFRKRGVSLSALSPSQGVLVNELNKTSKAVLHLMLQLPADRYFRLFCDNLFSTPNLFHLLRAFGIAACGTARSNRKNWPKSLKLNRKTDRLPFNTKLVEIVHRDVAAIVWQDKNLVQFLTTAHDLHHTTNVERRRPQARSKWMKNTVQRVWGARNAAVLSLLTWSVDYNNHMGGVDRHDQLRSYYPTQQTTFRTWLSLFFFLLDAAIINAYLLCKTVHPTRQNDPIMTHRYLRIRLAWNLVHEGTREMEQARQVDATQPRPTKSGVPKGNTTASRSRGYVSKHHTLPPIRFSPGHHKRSERYNTRKLCVYCRWLKNSQKQRVDIHKTLFYCSVCGPDHPLCDGCFSKWNSERS